MRTKCTVLFALFLLIATSCGAVEAPPQSLAKLVNSVLQDKQGSGIYVLDKGEDSLLARGWLADHAEQSIEVQYFIWSDDNIGILAAESLLRAADRGVKVRVIVDDLLIDAPGKVMVALASHQNIEIKIYNPKHSTGVSAPERVFHMLTSFRSFNQRMHDKTFIVDGNVAITGGRNMANEYFDYSHEFTFRDRDVLLLGPVVADMVGNFNAFWQDDITVAVAEQLSGDARRLSAEDVQVAYMDLHIYAQDPENFEPEVRAALHGIVDDFPRVIEEMTWGDIQFLHDEPGKNDGHGFAGGSETTRELTRLVAGARKQIIIQSPYLVMPKNGIEFFADLVKKGVTVKIVTNSLASTDNLLAFSGYAGQRDDLLEAGIEIYEFKPDPEIRRELIERLDKMGKDIPTFAIHAKTMVIDSETLFVGTFNMDPRSANLNTEVGVMMVNAKLAKQVEEAILADMLPENSWRAGVDDPDSHASFYKRLKINFWRMFPLEPIL